MAVWKKMGGISFSKSMGGDGHNCALKSKLQPQEGDVMVLTVLSSASVSVDRQPGRVGIGASRQRHVTKIVCLSAIMIMRV
jgi:hypothetical protein